MQAPHFPLNIPSRCFQMCPTRDSSELQLSNTPGERMWSAPLFLKIGVPLPALPWALSRCCM